MRYLPQTEESRKEMLKVIGAQSVDDLYRDVPKEAFIEGMADIPFHMNELDVERYMAKFANENHAAPDGPFFLGAGCYYHHIPATVDYIIQRSEFLTAYTPYQPEIAQGTLMAVYEFQTYIALLTGQEVANASLYDGATATTEAALMAMRVTKRNKVMVGNDLHPDYHAVLDTYMGNYDGVTIEHGEPDEETACVIVQSPDFYGRPEEYEKWRELCDRTGAMLIVVVTEIVSLGLLEAPSVADVVCGEAQSVGLPMAFGGPHLGFFATREKYMRQIPGRLVGETKDEDGKRGFVLTLNAREQHIRREKATSNICTNQGLCALAFTVHMSLLGEDGFHRLSLLNHERACKLADEMIKIDGVHLVTDSFFNEITVRLPKSSQDVVEALSFKDIMAGVPVDEDKIVMAATEMATDEDIETLAEALREVL